MSAADSYIRQRKREPRFALQSEPSVEQEKPPGPLVTQGVRSQGYPRPVVSTDELFRRALWDARGRGVWQRIVG